jgi:hypothetical protein
MKFMVVILLEPEPEGLVEFGQGDSSLNPGEETVPDRAEESFMLSST